MTHPGDEAFSRLVRQADLEARTVLGATLDAGEMLKMIKLRAARTHVNALEAVERRVGLNTVGATLVRAFSGPVQLAERPQVETAATLRPSDGLNELRTKNDSYSERSTDLDSVVSDAVRGDRAAIERLLHQLRPLVVRYCRALVGRENRSFAAADDVAQEVCLAVLQALPGYRDQGRPFLAFVYGIAAHKVSKARRDHQSTRAYLDEQPSRTSADGQPNHRNLHGEMSERMARLLAILPPQQREILVLRVVVGLSAEETADSIGSTPGAVRVAQHRALSTLRNALVEQVPE